MAGNTDMSNNGNSFDPMAQYARLSERVENQGKDIVDLRSNMNTGFQTVNSAISTLSNELRASGRTQWPAIWAALSVGVAILTGLGFMALQPIKDSIATIREDAKMQASETSTSISAVVDKMVTQKEMEWRTARGAEDRARTDASVKELRDAQVPREELDRVFGSYDQRFTDQQRQIDEVKTAQGSVYGARDILLDLRERIDRMERQRLSAAQSGG
jgi:CHASE3 domain sensor protein